MLVFGVTIKYICNKGNFAFVKYYHQKKRNRLTEQNTDALMRICHRNKELCSENLEKLVNNFKRLRKENYKVRIVCDENLLFL